MEPHSDSGLGSLLDMDLEGLDFETAYEMINEKAEFWGEHHDHEHMGLVDDAHFFETLAAGGNQSTSQIQPHSENAEHTQDRSTTVTAIPWKQTLRRAGTPTNIATGGAISRPQTPKNEAASPGIRGSEQYGINGSEREGLLSVNESHAIESFLDSLLTASPSKAASIALFSPKTASHLLKSTTDEMSLDSSSYLFDTGKKATVEKSETHFKEEMTHKSALHEQDGTVVGEQPFSLSIPTSFDRYEPIEPKIPVAEVPDKVIPSEVLSNLSELRRWKHVYLEKQRRNTFKKEYDALIGLIKYPRPDWSQIHKCMPNTKDVISLDYKLPKKEGKRVPKHTLLNYVIQDIQLLLLANEELEQMCQ